jgi:hypothetical protein
MAQKNISCLAYLLVGTLISPVPATDISISGTVKDSLTQKGISNATVSLKSFSSVITTTNENGQFSLSGSTGIIEKRSGNQFSKNPVSKNNSICFSISNNNTRVTIDVFNISGKQVGTLLNKNFGIGNYTVDLSKCGVANQFYLAKVQIGTQIFVLRYVYMSNRIISPEIYHNSINNNSTIMTSEVTAAVDTLIITGAGHRTLRTPVTSYAGTLSFSILADRPQSLAKISSVSPKGINGSTLSKRLAGNTFIEPTFNPGFINSGSPDYLTVTLRQIRLYDYDSIVDKEHNNYLSFVVWQGNKTLKLTGTGTVDVGDIVLDSFPAWKVTAIELAFSDTAVIKGTLIGTFNADTSGTKFLSEVDTFYTKYQYSYNASNGSGGADSSVGRSTAFKTAPAESTTVSLQGSTNGMAYATTPTNFKLDTAALVAPSLTLVFDLSRMLRFYNGCNLQHTGGVNPNDPANKAYFFCHSVFYGSVAAFFGTPGQIQGYESVYNCTEGNCGVKAWMTIICNQAGNIISGILLGNDDNDFTIAKGNITTVSGSNPYDFHYSGSNVDITGFQKATVLGDSTIVAWHQLATEGGNPERTGQAKFTLRFKTK